MFLFKNVFVKIFKDFDLDAEEGDDRGGSALMDEDNDYEDFWANPTFKDAVEKKQLEIRY